MNVGQSKQIIPINAARESITGVFDWIKETFGGFLTWSEFFLFAFLVILFIVWIILIHYTVVQGQVRQSRCYLDQHNYTKGSLYKVEAYDNKNSPLYSVTYDFNAKNYIHECSCPVGNVANNWTIPVFDIKSGSIENQPLKKLCNCNKSYDTVTEYYKGAPGLVRFMNSASVDTAANAQGVRTYAKTDTSFFDKAFES